MTTTLESKNWHKAAILNICKAYKVKLDDYEMHLLNHILNSFYAVKPEFTAYIRMLDQIERRFKATADVKKIIENFAAIIVGSAIVASKMDDEHAVWTADFKEGLPEFSLKKFQEIEKEHLAQLKWRLDFPLKPERLIARIAHIFKYIQLSDQVKIEKFLQQMKFATTLMMLEKGILKAFSLRLFKKQGPLQPALKRTLSASSFFHKGIQPVQMTELEERLKKMQALDLQSTVSGINHANNNTRMI